MKCCRFALIVFLLLPLKSYSLYQGKNWNLSDSSTISLITGAPGEDLYTKFGHSAIRVYDPVNRIDLVFNYGTFDFDTPGFYMKFIRGKLLYFMDAYEFKRMLYLYTQLNQSLFEQTLNLSPRQKQEIFDFLIKNYQPENRYYHYDSFFDNCSTRVRDVFKNTLGDRLVFHYDYITEKKSFLRLTNECLQAAPWGKFGIDLILGLPMDRVATPWERMFLPYEMMHGFGHAELKNDSSSVPFARPVQALYSEIPVTVTSPFLTPLNVFWGLFILILLLTAWQLKSGNTSTILDLAIFSLSGLLGLAILFMWFATDHHETKINMNILWALPFNLLLPYWMVSHRNSPLLKGYLWFFAGLNMIILMGWKFMPQPYHPAVIPVVLIYTLRCLFILVSEFYSHLLIKTKT